MLSRASRDIMELPLMTVCKPSGKLLAGSSPFISIASSRTMFRKMSYPLKIPAIFLDPFIFSIIFLSMYFFSSGVETIVSVRVCVVLYRTRCTFRFALIDPSIHCS